MNDTLIILQNFSFFYVSGKAALHSHRFFLGKRNLIMVNIKLLNIFIHTRVIGKLSKN